MASEWFTPRSARRALEDLRPVAEWMCRLVRELERRRPSRIVTEQPVERTYYRLVRQLAATVSEIRRRGAQVKDLKLGLLDFPARRSGRGVLLCWKVGEPSLSYWHEEDAGFAGRRPVDEDGPWEEG